MNQEVIDPSEVVDFSDSITWEKLSKIPFPTLTYILSAGAPNTYPGQEISQLKREDLISRILYDRNVQEYLFYRFETNPGLFNRLHLSLWNDAFPQDDREYCLKMRFAAAFLSDKDRVVLRSQNRRMTEVVGNSEPRLCDGKNCIRDQITSRTDAVMGDCGHAYLWGVRGLLRSGWQPYEISELKKYEAGFNLKSKDNPNIWYEPWIGKEPAYTCLYCITVLRWLLNQPRVTVFKDLDGQGPGWVSLDLTRAFYDEGRQVAKKQGLKLTL